MFCRALGALPLTEATHLGDLWAANPQLECVEGLGVGHRPALALSTISSGEASVRAVLADDLAADLPQDLAMATAELRRRLGGYPGAADGLAVVAPPEARDGKPQVEIEWRSPDGDIVPVSRAAPGLASPKSGAILRPALNGGGDVLPFLSLWWASLLTLSSLARYYPEQWADALDRDRSRTAIPIEEALEIGREILPWMLFHALSPGATE